MKGATNSTGARIPSLDGIRAISILMVCYGHLSGTRNFPVSITAYGRWCGDVAHLGVLVFFVISGFLITTLLMSERETTGAISLKRFYLRRIVRIFPAFYAFILVMAIATLSGAVHLTGRDFAYVLTYTVNVEPNRALQIGHLWSLSIEEQFYLLWPLTLLALRIFGLLGASLPGDLLVMPGSSLRGVDTTTRSGYDSDLRPTTINNVPNMENLVFTYDTAYGLPATPTAWIAR